MLIFERALISQWLRLLATISVDVVVWSLRGVFDPMYCNMPGFHVLHHLTEIARIHVHWVSQWFHLTISPTVSPFYVCPQSFPAEGSFPKNWFFESGDQCIRASPSAASVLPMNIQGWFPFELTCLVSLLSKGLSGVFLSTTASTKHHSFSSSVLSLLSAQLSHLYMTTEKTIAVTIWTFAKWYFCFLICCLGLS